MQIEGASRSDLRNHGFTLVELLMVVILAGILLSAAAGAFYPLLQSFRISTQLSEFERGLRHARRQAILHNQHVRLCPSDDGEYCQSRPNWSDGYIVYIDQEGNERRQADDTLLLARILPQTVSTNFNRNAIVSFNGMGRAGVNGSFTFCDPRHKVKGRKLVLVHSGRLRTETLEKDCS